MKFGVREICDVVLKAKGRQQIGNKVFYKDEPVIYFDSLKSSSMEGNSTTVYAQGGRGNARLVSWDGERTVTFTMEDALISPEGLMILTGAGLIDASEDNEIIIHATERVQLSKKKNGFSNVGGVISFNLKEKPYLGNSTGNNEDWIYVMLTDVSGEIISEPYIATGTSGSEKITIQTNESVNGRSYELSNEETTLDDDTIKGIHHTDRFVEGAVVFVDYYVARKSGAKQINITAESLSGFYYLEASTLFRDSASGQDMPAEFIIPKCKVQSNFNFQMASSGDPSTFTFTLDAFPDYTRFDKEQKVFSAIQVVTDASEGVEARRMATVHDED